MSQAMQNMFSLMPRLRLTQTICCNAYHTSAVLPVRTSDHYRIRTTPVQLKVLNNLDSSKLAKKKSKIEKGIRKLLRRGERILKPIEEKFTWPKLKRDIKSGVRLREDGDVFSSEQLESGILLKKRWCRYVDKKTWHERCIIARATKCQERALRKLQEESEELYHKAIQLDDSMFEYKTTGPTETPAKENYDAQDGVYQDKTDYFKREKTFTPDPKILQALKSAREKEREANA